MNKILNNNLQEAEILKCIEWLKLQAWTYTINRKYSSYSYKHMVEKWSGMYISNDSFKEAVKRLGIKSTDGINTYIAISQKWLNTLLKTEYEPFRCKLCKHVTEATKFRGLRP